jgi:osmotically-inducible protein OsmY
MKRTAMILAAVVILAALVSCVALTGRTAGEIVDDGTIVTTINAKIVEDPGLSYLKIDVGSKAGDVLLSGYVPNVEAESRLIQIARGVKGVKSVKSALKIQSK